MRRRFRNTRATSLRLPLMVAGVGLMSVLLAGIPAGAVGRRSAQPGDIHVVLSATGCTVTVNASWTPQPGQSSVTVAIKEVTPRNGNGEFGQNFSVTSTQDSASVTFRFGPGGPDTFQGVAKLLTDVGTVLAQGASPRKALKCV